MASRQTIGQLLVEIGLDSSKFLPELKKISQNIKGLEKDLKNMSKEFGDVGKSITGLEKKSELLNKVLSENNKAMNEHVKARDNYAEMLKKEKAELDELYNAQERDDKAIIQKEKAIQSLINKYNREENAISKLQQKQTDYQKQLDEVNEQYHRLTNNIETYEERLEGISEKTQLTNSELKSQQTILEANGKKWKAYNTQAQIIENSLASAIETYQEHRRELSKSETELSKLTQTSEAHRKSLLKEQQTLKDILKVHGETSEEYRRQASLVENMTRQQIEYEQTQKSTQEHVSKVKQNLANAKEEIAEYYKSLKEVGSTEVVRGLKYTSEELGKWSEKTQGASAVGAGIATGTTAMFMEYESGLAKLSTLTSLSKGQMEKVGQDIIKISNETGTSIGEMMEGAYQAVSAGVEIGNLNDFLSTSSKLATSGFTDMSSATKVLSQILNNYGTEAGNAEEIASKLMKTQNLGVTTVAELSSEMSESLSLASTYGMSFDNVATAFAKMTKAGTSTSEAGTAIARMMEELGSSSSKVSKILKEKTGKSFTELTEGGSSLFDILTILQQHADKTGVSMGDLWGSSNAGVGALQLLSSEGGTFNDMLQQISSSSGLLDESFNKMADTSEFKLTSAINNLKNSLIELGGYFAPFIEGFSNAINKVADWASGLDTNVTNGIGRIAGFTAVLSPLLGLVSKLTGGLGSLLGNFGLAGNILEKLGFDGKLVEGMKNLGKVASEAANSAVDETLDKMSKNLGKKLDTVGKGFTIEIDKDATEKLGKDTAKTLNEALHDENKKQKRRIGFNVDKETINESLGEAIEEGIEQSSKKKLSIDVDTSATKKVVGEIGEEITEEIGEKAVQSTGLLAKAGGAVKGVFSSLWGVISAHPLASVATGVGLVAGAVYLWNKHQEKLNHQHRENLASAKEEIATHEANVQSYKEQITSVKGLVEEYDKLNKKKSRTTEEEERRKQLLQEIAEISPNSVEYDANNDPIALKNDMIQRYIEGLEIAMKKEQTWLTKSYREQAKESKGALEEVYNEKYIKQQEELKKRFDKLQPNKVELEWHNGTTSEVENTEKLYDGSWISQAGGDEKALESLYNSRNQKIEEYLDLVEQEKMNISEYALEKQSTSNDICSAIQNEIDYQGYLNEASEQQKSTYDNFMSSMDFSDLNPDYLLTYSKQIAEAFANMSEADLSNMNNLMGEVNALNQEFANGQISVEEYTSQYEGLVDEISRLTGLDKDVVREMIKCPEFDAESVLKTSDDIETAKVKIAKALGDLTQIEDQDLRMDMAIQLANDKSLPVEIRKQIAEAIADGELTDEEIEMILNINSELGEEDIEETVDEAFDNLNIDTVDKAITVGLKVETHGDLNEFLNGLGLEKEKTINIKTAIQGDDWKGLAKEIKDLPTEQQVAILTAIANSGAMTPEQLASALQELPPEVRSKIETEYGDSLIKCNELDSALKILDQRETTVEIHGESGSAQAEIDKVRNENIENKTVKIKGDSSDVEKKKKEAEKGTESPHTIKGNDTDVKNKKEQAKKGTNNTHKIICNNSAVQQAFRDNKTNTSSYHTIYVQELLKGGTKYKKPGQGSGGSYVIGAKDPVIVPFEAQAVGKPIVIDDFTNKIAQAQASIQASATTYKNTENDAIATIQAKNYTDTILASSYWSGQQIDHSLDLLQDYMAQLDRLGNKLDIVGAKIDGAFGSAKAKYLKDQIKLLEQQQAMLKLQQKDAQTLANSYKSMLKKQGFKVDSNGAVTNATSKILELEHALEKAEKAQDSYNGKSESKQKSLAKAVEKAQDKLNKAKDTLSEYYEWSNKVGETEAEWREIANAIKEAKNEIYEANKAQENFYKEAKTVELEHQYDKLSDQLDIINSKMNLERNKHNTDLLKEELELLKQQQRQNEKIEGSYRNQMTYYRNYLSSKGFEFNEDGDITNGASALNKNKATDEIESIQDAYENYMELQRDTIPDLEKEWWDLENAEEDVQDQIKEIEEELKELEKEMEELNKIKFMDNIDELEYKTQQLEEEMSLLDAQMEHAYGYTKQQLIKQQISLIEEQQNSILATNRALQDQLVYLRQAMQSDGFTFDSKGNITNADSILQMAETQEEYDELKEKVEEYRDAQSQVTSNKIEWQNLQNEIIDTEKEIEQLKYEIIDMREEAEIQELANDFQVLQNELDKLQAQQELNGADLTKIYEEQAKVIEKQKEALDDQLAYQKKRANELENQLYEYGFRINDDGTIDNTANQLEYLKNILTEDEFDRVSSYLEEYYSVALEEIPQIEQEMIGLDKALQDIEKEKLDRAKEIEDQITEMIEKQVDDRIEEIEKERDAQVEAISKARDEYNKWRRDVDYEDDYNEQLEKVQELQAQLEIAKRDDSLSGQKRVADLMKELKEEQKALEDLVQDKIDQDIEDMFTEQEEKIESNAEDKIKDLEEAFSETNVAKIVAEAMKTGMFEDIHGNIVSLDKALLDFTNSTADAMGVMGNSIRSELLDNLSVALDYMKEMETVSINLSNIDYQSQRFAGVGYDKNTVQGGVVNNTSTTDNSSRTVNVEFNPIFNIEGTTDLDETQLFSILNRAKTDMIAEVQHQILNNMK